MKKRILFILLYIGISIIIVSCSYLLKSDFFSKFFERNFLPILLTLTAISNTNIALISNKLQELASLLKKSSFEKTENELKFSFYVQLVNVCLTFFLLIVRYSTIITSDYWWIVFIVDILLTAILICSLDILKDICNAIFSIVRAINELKQNDNNKK
jgi:hypothetical protein